MNPFVLAVILVRVVGAWTVVSFLPYLLSTITSLAMRDTAAPFQGSFGMGVVEMLVHPVAGLAAGGFLLLRAVWISRFVVRGLHPAGHCQRCGYNMVSAGATTCPECGHAEAKAS